MRARTCLPLPLAVLGGCLLNGATPAAADVWERSFEVTGVPQVVVGSHDASVQVETWDHPGVAFRVVTSGWRIGPGGVSVEASQSGARVELRVREPVWSISFFSIHSVRIEVSTPRRTDLEVDTGDGSVTVGALEGTTRLHTGDGAIRVTDLKGELWLRSGDGPIAGTGLDGKLVAHTGDGHVRISGRFDRLEVTTGDGRVELRAEPGSKLDSDWLVRTGDGGVDLSLPRELHANLDAHTGDGGIQLDLPVQVSGRFSRGTVVGALNGGGPPLVLRSGDGSIRIGPS